MIPKSVIISTDNLIHLVPAKWTFLLYHYVNHFQGVKDLSHQFEHSILSVTTDQHYDKLLSLSSVFMYSYVCFNYSV